MARMRFLCVLLLILGLCFALVDTRQQKIFSESGLEGSLQKFEAGAAVSEQYYELLKLALSQAREAYSAGLSGDAQGGLDRLRVATVRASAAGHELMMRAPQDSGTQRALDDGYRTMVAQLAALISRVKCCTPTNGQHAWDKYYDDTSSI